MGAHYLPLGLRGCLWCGRSVGRSVACSRRSDSGERCEVKRSAKKLKAREEAYGHVTTKISRMGSLPNFLTHSTPLRARGAPLLIDYPPPRGGGGDPEASRSTRRMREETSGSRGTDTHITSRLI